MLCTSRVSTRAITILNINKWLTQCYKLLWHTALCWWYKFALLKQVPQRHNKKINFDLKNIVHCLIANKISLNTGKTEIILFRTKTIEIKNHMNFRISDQKINIAKEAKYSELDQLLTFKQHTHTIKIKLKQNKWLFGQNKISFWFKTLENNLFSYLWNSSPIRLPTMGADPNSSQG